MNALERERLREAFRGGWERANGPQRDPDEFEHHWQQWCYEALGSVPEREQVEGER